MGEMRPSTEERTQAEAIIEAFENNDLEGSLIDEIASCLATFRHLGAADERVRILALLRAPSEGLQLSAAMAAARHMNIGQTRTELTPQSIRATLAVAADEIEKLSPEEK